MIKSHFKIISDTQAAIELSEDEWGFVVMVQGADEIIFSMPSAEELSQCLRWLIDQCETVSNDSRGDMQVTLASIADNQINKPQQL